MESQIKERDEGTELLIELLQGAFEEEGHETKRYSDSNKHFTSSYDCIEVKGNDGNYYSISIDKRQDRQHPYWSENGRVERKSEVFESNELRFNELRKDEILC